MKDKPRNHNRRQRLSLAIFVAVLVSVGVIGLAFFGLNHYPKVAALGADELRNIIGPARVANLETSVLQAEDWMRQWRFKITKQPVSAPWVNQPAPSGSNVMSPPGIPAVSTTKKDNLVNTFPAIPAGNISTGGSGDLSNLQNPPGVVQSPSTQQNPPGVSSGQWTLPTLPSMGNIQGEGTWQPYLRDATGLVVAERAFLQPDPQRPYAVVAIVAFDLQNTQLHFVLGTSEPKSSVTVSRPGTIPSGDMTPGYLLAAFNGGFRAQDGQFGTVVNGVTLLSPRDGLGTVAIYADGTVKIGMWGLEITPQPDLVIVRQNGPLMIHNGQINPQIADNNPQDWGYTIGSKVATDRSALGISSDGRTLYYAAGGSLTRPELALALQAAGAYQALQMDINNYWVHFDSFQFIGNNIVPNALLPAMKNEDDQRYLRGFSRDFFYVTSNTK